MTFVRKRPTARVAAAVVAPGLLAAGAVAGAGPAAADDGTARQGGAAATLEGLRISDEAVIRADGEVRRTEAGLFDMSVDGGGSLQTYSIDIDNPAQNQARYEEVPWKASSLHDNKNAGKIRWIVEHSYPQVNDLHALARTSGAKRLSPETAAAGTQVAIWRYSDGIDVEAADPAARKLADYLEKRAGKSSEPEESLSLSPAGVAGRTGDRLGPVTVHTNAPSVAVAPGPDAATHGVRLVDGGGEPVTSAADGSKLYFQLPEESERGDTSLTVQASTKVPVGRAFTGTGEHARSQAQVLAGSSQSTVSATAVAHWAESGPVPAVGAKKNCADSTVDVTVTNGGDAPYRFSLAGEKYVVDPGRTETAASPVQEDQPYRIAVPGPGGSAETFTGVLDCATAVQAADSGSHHSAGADGVAPQGAPGTGEANTGADGSTSAQPTATAGAVGEEAVTGAADADGDPDLAETGNSSNTPLIIGIAVALVVAGAIALLAVRRRTPEEARGEADGSEADAEGSEHDADEDGGAAGPAGGPAAGSGAGPASAPEQAPKQQP